MIATKRKIKDLDKGLILVPERYDPRRVQEINGIRLGDLVVSVKDILVPAKTIEDSYFLVLDTGDADRGLLTPKTPPQKANSIGSNKKIVKSGDVIISRLRPYLRQIALIPDGIVSEGVEIACSTEFFVLRGNAQKSIAFIVKWLLDDKTQEILRVGQEGGHHPRFTEQHLLNLIIPQEILDDDSAISTSIERASILSRDAMKILGSFPISDILY